VASYPPVGTRLCLPFLTNSMGSRIQSSDAAPSVLWTLRREGKVATCEVAFVPIGAEVRIFRNTSLLMSRIFRAEPDALAWVQGQYQEHIERGWVETGAVALDANATAGDVLIIRIGEDTGAFRECCLCARWFTTHLVQCVAHARFDDSTEMRLGVVCDTCVAVGPEGVRMRLATNAGVTQHADQDAEFAETLSRLSKGRIEMPRLEHLLAARNAPPPSGRAH
jgi:hypothetical protein